MNRELESDITNEFLDIIKKHKIEPQKSESKKKSPILKVALVTLAGILIFTLSFTYNPKESQIVADDTPKYYPINGSQIEITVKAASADDFPRIRIGPGCSFFKSKPKMAGKNHNQNV